MQWRIHGYVHTTGKYDSNLTFWLICDLYPTFNGNLNSQSQIISGTPTLQNKYINKSDLCYFHVCWYKSNQFQSICIQNSCVAFYSTFTLSTCCKCECKKWPKEAVLSFFFNFLWLVKMILPSPFAKKLQNQCTCGRIVTVTSVLRMWNHFVLVNCSHRSLIAFAFH